MGLSLEDMLSDTSQTQKDRHRAIPLTGGPYGIRPIETGGNWWEPGAERGVLGGDGELMFTGDRVPVWENKEVGMIVQ